MAEAGHAAPDSGDDRRQPEPTSSRSSASRTRPCSRPGVDRARPPRAHERRRRCTCTSPWQTTRRPLRAACREAARPAAAHHGAGEGRDAGRRSLVACHNASDSQATGLSEGLRPERLAPRWVWSTRSAMTSPTPALAQGACGPSATRTLCRFEPLRNMEAVIPVPAANATRGTGWWSAGRRQQLRR